MAHKKGTGSSKNGRDSNPQHRGVNLLLEAQIMGLNVAKWYGLGLHGGLLAA